MLGQYVVIYIVTKYALHFALRNNLDKYEEDWTKTEASSVLKVCSMI